jgi:hypothetical protein
MCQTYVSNYLVRTVSTAPVIKPYMYSCIYASTLSGNVAQKLSLYASLVKTTINCMTVTNIPTVRLIL